MRSATADRKGIDNAPNEEIRERLGYLAVYLEDVRFMLRSSIIVLSGYRCDSLNAAVGGMRNSAHRTGYAVDFVAPSYGDTAKVFARLSYALFKRFDQLILERSAQGGWLHLSIDPKYRGECINGYTGEVTSRKW